MIFITVNGSPSPGVTIDFLQDVTVGWHGTDYDNQTYTAASQGNGDVGDGFGLDEDEIVDGSGHLNTTTSWSYSDGLGQSVSSSSSSKSTNSVHEQLSDSDNGDESITVVNGHQTGDTESDTDNTSETADASDSSGANSQVRLSSTNPVTGLTITFVFADVNSDDTTEHETGGATDLHTGGTNSSDTISGEVDVDDQDLVHDQVETTFSIVGSNGLGQTFNLQNTNTRGYDETDNSLIDDGSNAAGTQTHTVDNNDTFDVHAGDTLSGSVTSTDPQTGVATSFSFNDATEETFHENADQSDTAIQTSAGTTNDTPTSTESGSDTVNVHLQGSVTQTNANGTTFGATASIETTFSDTQTSANGVVTDQGIINGASPNAGLGASGATTPASQDTGTGTSADYQIKGEILAQLGRQSTIACHETKNLDLELYNPFTAIWQQNAALGAAVGNAWTTNIGGNLDRNTRLSTLLLQEEVDLIETNSLNINVTTGIVDLSGITAAPTVQLLNDVDTVVRGIAAGMVLAGDVILTVEPLVPIPGRFMPLRLAPSSVELSALKNVRIPTRADTATKLSRRLSNAEMASLQASEGVEFAQVYIRGAGPNGGGGQTLLIRGTAGNVNLPAGSNVIIINHTHPTTLQGFQVPLRASTADRNALSTLQRLGSPQRTSTIITESGEVFRFSATRTRLQVGE